MLIPILSIFSQPMWDQKVVLARGRRRTMGVERRHWGSKLMERHR